MIIHILNFLEIAQYLIGPLNFGFINCKQLANVSKNTKSNNTRKNVVLELRNVSI